MDSQLFRLATLLPWEYSCPEPLQPRRHLLLPLEGGTNTPSPIKLCESLPRSSFLQHSWQHPGNSSSFPGLHAARLPFLLPTRRVVAVCPCRCAAPASTSCHAAACSCRVSPHRSPGSVGTPMAGLAHSWPCGPGCRAGSWASAVSQPWEGDKLSIRQQSSSRAQGRWWCLAHLPLYLLLPVLGLGEEGWGSRGFAVLVPL